MRGHQRSGMGKVSIICVLALLTMTACVHTETENKRPAVEITEQTAPGMQMAEVEPMSTVKTEVVKEASADEEFTTQQFELTKEWSKAFQNRDPYVLTTLYEGDGTFWSQTPDKRYDQMEQMLYGKISDDWILNPAECQYIYEAKDSAIWYYVREPGNQAVVIRQKIKFVMVDGKLKVSKVSQTIYNSVDTKKKYKAAYLVDHTPIFYDFYSNLCDLAYINGVEKVYQDPGTAAKKLLHLTSGKVTSVVYKDAAVDPDSNPIVSRDDTAEVTYEFSDGTVTIPMYKTYSGVWLPGEDGVSGSRVANSNFQTLTKQDFENAVDVRKDTSWFEREDAKLYLFEDLGGIKFYGASENYLIVSENGVTRPYAIAWQSPMMLDLKFAKNDYDHDKKKEIACSIHLGTGTGVSVDYLYMFDRNEDGQFQTYQYSSDDYLEDLESLYAYTYDKKTDEIQLYVSGRPIAPALSFQKSVESTTGKTKKKLTFDGIYVGDYISFTLGKTVQIGASLEGFAKDEFMPGFYPGDLDAQVNYLDEGYFYLTDGRLTSYDSKPCVPHENGLKRIKDGKSSTCDLDGDGKKDKIIYKRVKSKENANATEPQLTINDTKYNADDLMKLGVCLDYWDDGFWYTTDLDTSDSYKEIALYDAGPSGDPVTFFLRFDGKKLISCGSVDDNPEIVSFIVHGNGKVSANKRLETLQTWWADTEYKLDKKGVLKEKQPKWYHPYVWKQDSYTSNYFLKDVKLYASPDMKASTISVPKGTQIYLTATDDKHWIEVTTFGWKKGWMYAEDYETIKLPKETIKATDLMSHLMYVD